jgi:uncharacterized protein (TIGR02421 family)
MHLQEPDLDTAYEIGRDLTEIEREIEFLLNLTPVNTADAWIDFERGGFGTAPSLRSRPLGYEADLVRRRLYALEIERIDDTAIRGLYKEKRDEIGRMITLLEDRDTSRFVYESLQLFGEVSDALVADAFGLLDTIDTRSAPDSRVGARAFAEAAEQELATYRSRYEGFAAELEVRSDISDLMVSHGRFLIPSNIALRARRVDPLIQHEIGTHVVTFENARIQPLQLLTVGLPGYDETQEGLAVLAEYVSGGLDPQRLRLLAARVVAVARMLEGAEFLDIFGELHDKHEFHPRVAWGITSRVVRSGGLTKDVIYLRGISRVLEFCAERKTIEPLLLGKLSLDHVPLIEDLRERGVLRPVWITPRWTEGPEAEERLARVYEGMRVRDLVEEVATP